MSLMADYSVPWRERTDEVTNVLEITIHFSRRIQV